MAFCFYGTYTQALALAGSGSVFGPYDNADDCDFYCVDEATTFMPSTGTSSTTSLEPDPCGHCAVSPYQWTLSMSLVTNNTCNNCGFFNDNFTLTYNPGFGGTCYWNLFVPGFCGTTHFSFELKYGGGNWVLTLGDGGFLAAYVLDDGHWNCFGPNVMALFSTGGNPHCHWPPTVTLDFP